jgi:hypothetical protein
MYAAGTRRCPPGQALVHESIQALRWNVVGRPLSAIDDTGLFGLRQSIAGLLVVPCVRWQAKGKTDPVRAERGNGQRFRQS